MSKESNEKPSYAEVVKKNLGPQYESFLNTKEKLPHGKTISEGQNQDTPDLPIQQSSEFPNIQESLEMEYHSEDAEPVQERIGKDILDSLKGRSDELSPPFQETPIKDPTLQQFPVIEPRQRDIPHSPVTETAADEVLEGETHVRETHVREEPIKPKEELTKETPVKEEPIKPKEEPTKETPVKEEPVKPKEEPTKETPVREEPIKPKEEPTKETPVREEPIKPKEELVKEEPIKPKEEPTKETPVREEAIKPKEEPVKEEPIKPKEELVKEEPIKPKEELTKETPAKEEPIKPTEEPIKEKHEEGGILQKASEGLETLKDKVEEKIQSTTDKFASQIVQNVIGFTPSMQSSEATLGTTEGLGSHIPFPHQESQVEHPETKSTEEVKPKEETKSTEEVKPKEETTEEVKPKEEKESVFEKIKERMTEIFIEKPKELIGLTSHEENAQKSPEVSGNQPSGEPSGDIRLDGSTRALETDEDIDFSKPIQSKVDPTSMSKEEQKANIPNVTQTQSIPQE